MKIITYIPDLLIYMIHLNNATRSIRLISTDPMTVRHFGGKDHLIGDTIDLFKSNFHGSGELCERVIFQDESLTVVRV